MNLVPFITGTPLEKLAGDMFSILAMCFVQESLLVNSVGVLVYVFNRAGSMVMSTRPGGTKITPQKLPSGNKTVVVRMLCMYEAGFYPWHIT